MRVHLPALLALVSAATYVACGSSDQSKTEQEGGAAGEGGETTGAGGTQSGGGSKSGGGTNSGVAGEGGAPTGGVPTTGTGGAEGGAVSALGGAGGEGGGAEPVDPDAFPASCPGAVSDYFALDGGAEPDTFTGPQLDQTVPDGTYSQVFARGFAGNDTFEYNNAGADCLLGGDGDDDFSLPGEYGSVIVGGAGADVYHLRFEPNNTPSQIVDMSGEDTIGISKAGFDFLAGNPGAAPYDTQLHSVADYEAGTGTVPTGEGAAIVYDPATGGLWLDLDRGMKGQTEVQLLKIGNAGSYTYDINDFVLED